MASAAVSPDWRARGENRERQTDRDEAPDLDDAARPRVASGKLARLLFATRYGSEE